MANSKHVVWIGGTAADTLLGRLNRNLDTDIGVTLSESAHDAQIVITACGKGDELQTLVMGPQGLIADLRAGTTYIDVSWIDESLSHDIARAARVVGVDYLRAPLTQGAGESQEPVVTAMLSGPQVAVDASTQVLELFADKIIYLGTGDEARAMTRVLDVVMGISIGMWAEALVLGEAADLAWREMVQVMETSAIASPLIKAHAARVANRDYRSSITCGEMKDRLGAAVSRGKSLGVVMSLTGIAHQMFLGAAQSGASDLGLTAVIPWMEALAGLQHPAEAEAADTHR